MSPGDRATFRDPLSRRVTEVLLLETATLSHGRGVGFNVRDDAGRHWTSQIKFLRKV